MSQILHHLHFFCAAYMTGIIWFVQRVHYPMLRHSNGPEAAAGHREYTRRMGYVVMPVMLAELALQGWWTVADPGLPSRAGAALLALVWISTFALQVPRHRRLSAAFDPRVHRGLVATNWIRTAAWTARAGLLVLIATP